MTSNDVKVSVLMLTYNHENYIKLAIEGVLMQKTNFNFELIIGEDYSTDKTRDIVLDYKNKYPDKIKLVLQEKNVGPSKNFIDILNISSGKYIAICEGDDYWIDPYKLQKQVDFLENNPDYSLVYTDFIVINEHDIEIYDEFCYKFQKARFFSGYVFWELFKRNFIPNLTVLYKKEILNDFLKEIENKWYLIDYLFWLHIAFNSKIKYLDLKSAKYRRHKKGFTYSRQIEKSKPYIYFHIIKKFFFNNKALLSKKEKEILSEKICFIIFYNFIPLKDKFKLLKLLFNNNPGFLKITKFLYKGLKNKIKQLIKCIKSLQ